ncbi:MAG: hypothetical protein L6W00_13790 [Lentisphaeria bacterium]|nr:MAG: hypothetical protein L6W00_13790 [Lentisphaeria bacterium]
MFSVPSRRSRSRVQRSSRTVEAKRQRRIQKEDQHPGNQDEFHGEYGG